MTTFNELNRYYERYQDSLLENRLRRQEYNDWLDDQYEEDEEQRERED